MINLLNKTYDFIKNDRFVNKKHYGIQTHKFINKNTLFYEKI